MNATLPVEAPTNRLGAGAWDTLRASFPGHFGSRVGVAVTDALRATTMRVDEVEVTLDVSSGWFADILLSGGGRLESVVVRLRPQPVSYGAA